MGKFCPECGQRHIHSHSTMKLAKKAVKKARKPSAYNKRYSRAFKKHSPRFKKKGGGWKKNGYKSAVKAAHREARK